MDAQLARFGARDPSVLLTNAILGVLPFIEPLPGVESVGALVARVAPGAGPSVVARAEDLSAEDRARKCVWVATGIDAGDGVVSVVGGVKAALTLNKSRKGEASAPADFAGHQAADAVLKVYAVAHILDRLLPQDPDPVGTLLAWETGRALVAWMAAVEVALPFVGEAVAGQAGVGALVAAHGSTQAARLASIVGGPAVESAARLVPGLVLGLAMALTALFALVAGSAMAGHPGALAALLGEMVAIALLTTLLSQALAPPHPRWLAIGLRVGGSWITAASLLMVGWLVRYPQ